MLARMRTALQGRVVTLLVQSGSVGSLSNHVVALAGVAPLRQAQGDKKITAERADDAVENHPCTPPYELRRGKRGVQTGDMGNRTDRAHG